MDHQDAKLISKISNGSQDQPKLQQNTQSNLIENGYESKQNKDQKNLMINKQKINQQSNKQEEALAQNKSDQPIDVIKQLQQKQNPLPILAVLDQVDLYKRTQQGVPLFNLLMNKFLPVSDLLQKGSIKFEKDKDGRTPLHYAIQADDVKTAQWLLSKGAHNQIDNFGNAPVADAVRLGHRRCFLLCLHYQHVTQDLPHIAAKYNRTWQLKCMLSLGLNLDTKNQQNKTPFQVAIQNYSYESAQYLAIITQQNFTANSLRKLTDSQAIIRRVISNKINHSFFHRAFIPLLKKIIQIFIILFMVNFSHYFQSIHQHVNYGILLIVVLQIVMYAQSICQKPKIKSPQSITRLLHQPYFPNNLDHVCPQCFNRYHPEKQDHCNVCYTCVPHFQQHTYMCINKYNQIYWYMQSYLYCFILYQIVKTGVQFTISTYPPAMAFSSTFPRMMNYCYTVYHMAFLQNSALLAVGFILLTIFMLKQILFCLQLFGMAFMGRTYQQIIRTQDYPHLYSVFKNKAGKMKTKENRIFGRYKLCGGLLVGLRNIIVYFFV